MKIPTLKRFLSLAILTVAILQTCYGATEKEKAEELAKTIQAVLKPGEIATSASGYAMKAKLNGKEWVATAMRSPFDTGRIIGSKGEESIGLPFSKSSLVAGRTIKFGENKAVDLMTNDDVGIWGGLSGEMTFTKVDQNSAEGTFFFTATARNTTKKVEVTEGTFRILLGKR
jgi:hypothetical protein